MKFGRILVGILLLSVVVSAIWLQPVPEAPANAGRAPATTQNQIRQTQNQNSIYTQIAPQITIPARDLPPYQIEPTLDREINPRMAPLGFHDSGLRISGGPDPLLAAQNAISGSADMTFVTPLLNFDGQPYGLVNPPDTVGAVGLQHYVQMVNNSGGAAVAIYDKDTGTGIMTFKLDQLATGNCGNGFGDPIVLFDQLAERWLLSEFSVSGNYLCVYISQGSDPTGSYYVYAFQTPSFPDYPKYAVWPDAYYVTTNESTSVATPAVYALDRSAMLAGETARVQRFTVPPLVGFGFQALTPGDWDGATPPPAGSPAYFMRHRDTEAHGPAGFPTQDFLEVWAFSVDWFNPTNSTFTQSANISVAEFDSDLCGLFSFECIVEPDIPPLDPLREVIMWRLQYRNFGTHETLVGNFATDVTGNDEAGVRWFELRRSGAAAWSLYQEGTYSPDNGAINRWMGSIAMDSSGNLALAYNVANGTTVYPGLRYAGRLASDPLGTLPQGEYVLVDGSDTSISNRYGDYSAMTVDPVDDCTFWFTGEYNSVDGVSGGWSTRIAAFKFSNCGTGSDFALAVEPAHQVACSADSAIYRVDVTALGSFSDDVELSANDNPGVIEFDPAIVTPTDSSTMSVTGATSGAYTFEVIGSASMDPSLVHTEIVGLDVMDPLITSVTLISPVNNTVDAPLRPTFTWTENTNATTYLIEIATDAAFSDIVASAETTSPSYTLDSDLADFTTYYWRVTPGNACGTGPVSTTSTLRTVASAALCTPGSLPQTIYFDDFESGASGWTHGTLDENSQDTWELLVGSGLYGSVGYHASDLLGGANEQVLLSPVVAIPAELEQVTLQFFNQQRIEAIPAPDDGCYDGALLEISADNGATWTQLDTELLTDPYDGVVSADYNNPLGGRNAWCGDPQEWLNAVVTLDDYIGNDVQFRFQFGTDGFELRDGWDIDNVLVQSCVGMTTYEISIPVVFSR
ncbi:MAG: hypothetical protein M9930_18870 [Anaerolineae bacterium]|nr:hypothetical protein [Anaerolineae bacterium]